MRAYKEAMKKKNMCWKKYEEKMPISDRIARYSTEKQLCKTVEESTVKEVKQHNPAKRQDQMERDVELMFQVQGSTKTASGNGNRRRSIVAFKCQPNILVFLLTPKPDRNILLWPAQLLQWYIQHLGIFTDTLTIPILWNC